MRRHTMRGNFAGALTKLPLFDDLFLRMQALNLSVVHEYLSGLEDELVRELVQTERTPPGTIFVSALSQLWVFGVYEILRTWRQRGSDVLSFVTKVKGSPRTARRKLIDDKKRSLGRSSSGPLDLDMRWSQFQKALDDPRFVKTLVHAMDRFEFGFRRIEALRVALAKHEMPDAKGVPATFPGYARIDSVSRSIQWQTSLRGTSSGGTEIDILTRKEIAEDCISAARDRKRAILPRNMQSKLQGRAPKTAWDSYGVHRIIVRLKNGNEYHDVFVAWYKQILAVGGRRRIPFDPNDVIDVRPQ